MTLKQLVCSNCGKDIDGRAVTTRERAGKLFCLTCFGELPAPVSPAVTATGTGNPAATFAILMMIAGVVLGAYGAYLAFHSPS